MPFEKVGLLYYSTLADSAQLASQIVAELRAHGVAVWECDCDEQSDLIGRVSDLDMFIALGGDGTILRTARTAAPYGIPILGVNLGRLGFLAEMEPSEVLAQVPRLCDSGYWLEERLMLHAEHWRGAELLASYEALNDVIVARGAMARVVRVSVRVDGAKITTYVADGIIAATATGSTAYSLSAGGPVAPPDSKNILLTPIAPHLTPARSIVLPASCQITMSLETNHDGVLTVDGYSDVMLENGDTVCISESAHVAQFVRLGPKNYFFKTLIQRLNRRAEAYRG